MAMPAAEIEALGADADTVAACIVDEGHAEAVVLGAFAAQHQLGERLRDRPRDP